MAQGRQNNTTDSGTNANNSRQSLSSNLSGNNKFGGYIPVHDVQLAAFKVYEGWGHGVTLPAGSPGNTAFITGVFNSTAVITEVNIRPASGTFTAGTISLLGSE